MGKEKARLAVLLAGWTILLSVIVYSMEGGIAACRAAGYPVAAAPQ